MSEFDKFDASPYGGLPPGPPPRKEVGPPGQRELYTEGEFLRDYNDALQQYTVPGYPAYEDRLRMDDPSEVVGRNGEITLPYDASQPWCPANFYPTHAIKPMKEGQFIDDGGIHPPTDEERALWESMGIRTDQRGMPVHPYAEGIVLGGQTSEGEWVHPGGVVTPGYYYKRGPQKTADMLLVAEENNKLYGLFIERKDNGLVALPGGHVEAEDTQKSEELEGRLSEYEIGGIRELGEETGVDIQITEDGLTCSGLAVVLKKIWVGVGADQRSTLHSWPQGETFAAFLPQMPSQKPKADTDAKRVSWLPLSDETFAKLAKFSNHNTMARRAVRTYRDQTGTRIDPDGGIW